MIDNKNSGNSIKSIAGLVLAWFTVSIHHWNGQCWHAAGSSSIIFPHERLKIARVPLIWSSCKSKSLCRPRAVAFKINMKNPSFFYGFPTAIDGFPTGYLRFRKAGVFPENLVFSVMDGFPTVKDGFPTGCPLEMLKMQKNHQKVYINTQNHSGIIHKYCVWYILVLHHEQKVIAWKYIKHPKAALPVYFWWLCKYVGFAMHPRNDFSAHEMLWDFEGEPIWYSYRLSSPRFGKDVLPLTRDHQVPVPPQVVEDFAQLCVAQVKAISWQRLKRLLSWRWGCTGWKGRAATSSRYHVGVQVWQAPSKLDSVFP